MEVEKVGVKETSELVKGFVKVVVVTVGEVKKAKATGKVGLGTFVNIGKALFEDETVKEAVKGVKEVWKEVKDLDVEEIGLLAAGAIEGAVGAYKALKPVT